MIDQPPRDLVLAKLDEIRKELHDVCGEQAITNEKIGAMASGMVSLRKQGDDMVAGTRLIAVAVDDHTHRLDQMDARLGRIEKKLGLLDA